MHSVSFGQFNGIGMTPASHLLCPVAGSLVTNSVTRPFQHWGDRLRSCQCLNRAWFASIGLSVVGPGTRVAGGWQGRRGKGVRLCGKGARPDQRGPPLESAIGSGALDRVRVDGLEASFLIFGQ
jgi:hypothetical protein